jgi:outer membrane protein OmpA-like peptidoglycan-associated protein
MRIAIMLPVVAFAVAARADPVEIALKNQVAAGQKPAITLKALAAVSKLQVELVREDDGKKFTVGNGALREGQSATLPFGDGRAGRARWKGTLVATFPDGNRFTTALTFETAVASDLKIAYRRDRLDLDAHTLEFQLSRPAARAELTVVGEDGSELGRGEAVFDRDGAPPGSWLRVGWTQKPGNVLRLDLRAVAVDGQATVARLTPWMVRVPHEEVVFDTGKWTILPSEAPKLEASLARINAQLATVRRADPSLSLKLFVAGHTDTVGRPEDNRRLSLERARAIGGWFRAHGLGLPIACAGLGEDAPRVKTPDETDEPANRRADYILGVDEPQLPARANFVPLR